MIGHNIMFDWQMVTKPDVKLICSKELAIKYLTKQSGAGTKGVNTLTGLIERYYPEEAKELIANAHSALQDCKLTYLILLKVLEVAPELDSFDKLAAQCSQPTTSKTDSKLPYLIEQDSYTKQHLLKFGKYKGESLEVLAIVDRNYLTWIVEKSTMPQDLKDFIKQFMLGNR
jgi:exodeoxyribonuclease X